MTEWTIAIRVRMTWCKASGKYNSTRSTIIGCDVNVWMTGFMKHKLFCSTGPWVNTTSLLPCQPHLPPSKHYEMMQINKINKIAQTESLQNIPLNINSLYYFTFMRQSRSSYWTVSLCFLRLRCLSDQSLSFSTSSIKCVRAHVHACKQFCNVPLTVHAKHGHCTPSVFL